VSAFGHPTASALTRCRRLFRTVRGLGDRDRAVELLAVTASFYPARWSAVKYAQGRTSRKIESRNSSAFLATLGSWLALGHLLS